MKRTSLVLSILIFFSTSSFAEEKYLLCDSTYSFNEDRHFWVLMDKLIFINDTGNSVVVLNLWTESTSYQGIDVEDVSHSTLYYVKNDDKYLNFEYSGFTPLKLDRKTLFLKFASYNGEEGWQCSFISKDEYDANVILHEKYYENFRKERREGNKL